MNMGLLSGVAVNVYLWLSVGDQLFWFWWNFIGAAVTFGVAFVASLGNKSEETTADSEPVDMKFVLTLIASFVLMVVISLLLKNLI